MQGRFFKPGHFNLTRDFSSIAKMKSFPILSWAATAFSFVVVSEPCCCDTVSVREEIEHVVQSNDVAPADSLPTDDLFGDYDCITILTTTIIPTPSCSAELHKDPQESLRHTDGNPISHDPMHPWRKRANELNESLYKSIDEIRYRLKHRITLYPAIKLDTSLLPGGETPKTWRFRGSAENERGFREEFYPVSHNVV